MKRIFVFLATVIVCILLAGIIGLVQAGETPGAAPSSTAYMASVMDRYHATLDVYTDADAAGNHFVTPRAMTDGSAEAVPPMNMQCSDNPHSGTTCIECRFTPEVGNWSGWYFLNGILQREMKKPAENWGEYPGVGMNLTGSATLTFWARGAQGGERVEFFAFGIETDSRNAEGQAVYGDSARKVTTDSVTLTPEWQQYAIDTGGEDLINIIGGFGWTADAVANGDHNVTFYLDDIRYDLSRLDEPRFLVSYTPSPGNDVEETMRNAAFTYDSAVALLTFLAAGESDRAGLIADALVYAQNHDRFFDDGRIRNAYAGGDAYLQAAERMGDRVEENCYNATGIPGYTGGFDGWEDNLTPLTYKSTEHNLDCAVAFQKLYGITGNETYKARAGNATGFVEAMWDNAEGKFWMGTHMDGQTINPDVVPLDVQAWSILALPRSGDRYARALAYAEQNLSIGGGFDFNQDRDGVWYEGTAQMAAAYRQTGVVEKWQNLVDYLHSAQDASGGMPAADRDGLTTGINVSINESGAVRWVYCDNLHTGATAWLVFAEQGVNPFWMGNATDNHSSFPAAPENGSPSHPPALR